MPAAGHRADHHAISRVEFIEHRARHVPQPARHSMSLHCGTNRFRNHQPDLRAVFCPTVRTQGVHHQIGLHRAHPSAHRRPEVARPRHPVPRRKHRASSWIGLRRQRATALAAPVRHDGPAGPGPHPQPEAVHPCPAPVVRLESPLALGHGSISLLRLAPAAHTDRRSLRWTRLPLVSSSVPLDRRGPHSILGRSRAATSGRLFEGTDEFCLGQTLPAARPHRHIRHTGPAPVQGKNPLPSMLRNGWHPARKLLASAKADSITKRRQTTK